MNEKFQMLKSKNLTTNEKFQMLKSKNLKIDATRGKPCAEQLALGDKIFNTPLQNFFSEDGTDVRNYGGNDGLIEMKRIFAELLGVDVSEIIVGANSSLNMMFDCIATMILEKKWDATSVKFICPVPGYDRHFA
ncbi:MAG: aminotransferase, partial [Defluviitaleaceae bacterium]|nr:aminotransferase [Defluviitaleaceae bacterium]